MHKSLQHFNFRNRVDADVRSDQLTSVQLDNSRLRYWNDKLSTELSILSLLADNFCCKIPRQHKHIVRLIFNQTLGSLYRNLVSGHVPSLLELVKINDVVQMSLIKSAIRKQSSGLSGGCITNDSFALVLQSPYKRDKTVTNRVHSFRKVAVEV